MKSQSSPRLAFQLFKGIFMKKIIAVALLALCSLGANAATFFSGGTLMGTVCRAGYYYTVYPAYNAQPVGTSCPVRDNFGRVVAWGIVTDE
jgi:hypothetical protein